MDSGVIEMDTFTKCAVETELEIRPLDNRVGKVTKCCLCLIAASFIGVSYFAYSTLYDSPNSFVDGFSGASTEELQGGKDPHLVEEGTTSLLAPNNPGSIQEWLDAEVTLRDGIKYEVVQQMSHAPSSFTEGLTFANGKLYESIGLVRKSALLELDPETGETVSSTLLPSAVFGEGLTYFQGKFVQLTYKQRMGYIYDANDLSAAPTTFPFDTTTHEGWGITYDKDQHELIVSDGSAYLHIWDPDTMVEKRKVLVKLQNGRKATNINELEYWRGRVLANVWYEDNLLVINPLNGSVEKEYGASHPRCQLIAAWKTHIPTT